MKKKLIILGLCLSVLSAFCFLLCFLVPHSFGLIFCGISIFLGFIGTQIISSSLKSHKYKQEIIENKNIKTEEYIPTPTKQKFGTPSQSYNCSQKEQDLTK